MLSRKRSASVAHLDRAAPAVRSVHRPTISVGAQAIGARAIGAQAVWGLALAAVAIGAVAIGALAIGKLAIGRARIRRLEIDELVVRRLRLADPLQTLPNRDAESESRKTGNDHQA